MWVSSIRLRVLWDEADAFVQDELHTMALEAACYDGIDSVDNLAAFEVASGYPVQDGILIHPLPYQPATIEIADLERACHDLGLIRSELEADPLSFTDRTGTFLASWSTAYKVARRIAEIYPDQVLQIVDREERELRAAAVHGKWVSPRRDREYRVPAERFAKELRERQPVFHRIRPWCQVDAVKRYDEAEALRAEIERLRALVEDAARFLESAGRASVAGKIRKRLMWTQSTEVTRRIRARRQFLT